MLILYFEPKNFQIIDKYTLEQSRSLLYFLTSFHFYQHFIAKKGKWRTKEVVLPPGSNIVKDWQEVARYVFLLLFFPLFSFFFFFLSSSFYLHLYSSFSRNCYAQSAIRLFRRYYPKDRNADVPVFSTLWIKFALHSIFSFLGLFRSSSNFVSSFRLKQFFPFFFQRSVLCGVVFVPRWKFQTIFHRFRISLH